MSFIVLFEITKPCIIIFTMVEQIAENGGMHAFMVSDISFTSRELRHVFRVSF